jgi:hypothetical protein
MTTLFWVCWGIDLLILLVWLLETFLTGSGSGILLPLIAIVATSWWLRVSNPKWALTLAAFPASILMFFVIAYSIMLLSGKSNWQ